MIKITPIRSVIDGKKQPCFIDPWQVSTVKAINDGDDSYVSLANGEYIQIAENPRAFSSRVVAAKNAAPTTVDIAAETAAVAEINSENAEYEKRRSPAPVTATGTEPLRWKGVPEYMEKLNYQRIPDLYPSRGFAEKVRAARSDHNESDIVALLNDENKRLRAALEEIAAAPHRGNTPATESMKSIPRPTIYRTIDVLRNQCELSRNIARKAIGQTVK